MIRRFVNWIRRCLMNRELRRKYPHLDRTPRTVVDYQADFSQPSAGTQHDALIWWSMQHNHDSDNSQSDDSPATDVPSSDVGGWFDFGSSDNSCGNDFSSSDSGGSCDFGGSE